MTAGLISLLNLEASQVMTRNLLAIAVSQNLDIFTALSLLHQDKILRVPALDKFTENSPVMILFSIRSALKPPD